MKTQSTTSSPIEKETLSPIEDNHELILCDICSFTTNEEPSVAHSKCNDCNKNLCEGHLLIHKTRKATKDHVIVPLVQQQFHNNLENHVTTVQLHHYCNKHEDLLDHYCKDCNEIICLKCALFNHINHNYYEIKKIINEQKEKYLNSLKDLSLKNNFIEQRKENIEILISKVNERFEKIKFDLDKNFMEINKALFLKKEDLLEELNRIYFDKLNLLNNEKLLLEKYNEQIIINLNEKYNELNDIDIFLNELKFEKKINEINNLQIINNLNNVDKFKLNIINDKINLISIIDNHLGKFEIDKINNTTLQNYLNNLQLSNNNNNSFSCKFELITTFGINDKANNWLRDIVIDNNDKIIYLVDYHNKRILIFNNIYKFQNEIKLTDSPLCIALDTTNNSLLIACNNNKIYRFTKRGILLNTINGNKTILNNKVEEFNYVTGMTVDKIDGTIYLCDSKHFRVLSISKDEKVYKKFGTKGNENGQFNFPNRITMNSKSELVVSDANNHRIQIFDKNGNFIRSFGKYGNGISEFIGPSGIVCDGNDNYIICDLGNNRVQIFDKDLNFLKLYNINLKNPIGIAFNTENGYLFIVEYGDNWVKVFK